MLLPLVVVVLSVLAGTVLALAPREGARHVGPIRTFALTAALGVVAVHLLPEAIHAAGLWALPGVVVGAAIPSVVRFLVASAKARRKKPPDGGAPIALEVSYAGLLAHQFGDGLSMGAYGGPHHDGHGHGNVLIAIAAHTVPVTAVFVLAFAAARGKRVAVLHAVGLVVAAAFGIAVASFATTDWIHGPGGWVAALVAGLLVHVVLHDLRADPPTGTAGRALDFVAAAAGLGVAFIGSGSEHGLGGWGASARQRLWDSLRDLTLDTAPMLLVGLAIASALQAFGARRRGPRLGAGNPLGQAARGAVLGAPLPLCSCSVLPVAGRLHARRAAPALVVAFLIATPELGIETFLLTGRLLGWPFAWLRLGAALGLALCAGLVVSYAHRAAAAKPLVGVARDDTDEPPDEISSGAPPADDSATRRFITAFDELLFHVGAWTAIGLVAAAFIESLLPPGAFAHLSGSGLDLLVVAALSIPTYVCASSATPLGAVLIAKGLSPGAVLIGLLLGPATNVASLAFVKRAYGTKALVAALCCLVLVGWGFASLLNLAIPDAAMVARRTVEDGPHSAIAQIATLVLLALLARSIWSIGARGWLSAVLTAREESRIPDTDPFRAADALRAKALR